MPDRTGRRPVHTRAASGWRVARLPDA